ncbi:hypothetical protein PV328_004317 [Microctonus aethiopoides]|uniref:DUF4371 domain-containing protein n=1 Tax=Microctonus aethiopoides TaxID=144406 RepID=A0AA39KLF7_9HYME|nr:hypothetical protein PV328_004317 [Microctonus aethiopoides]
MRTIYYIIVKYVTETFLACRAFPNMRSLHLRWLELDESFRSWLCEPPNDSKNSAFFCRICDKSMAGGVAHIRPHATSDMHVTNLNKIGEDMTTQDAVESDLPFDVRKNIAEIRFSALILEKNIPYQTARDILKFFQSVGKDPNVLANMKMGRTKCSNIISNVLCLVETKRVTEKLQNTRFSIFVDETSDITNEKWMTFLVRYIDESTLDIRTQLIKLINLDTKNCGADQLFIAFKKEMYK